MMKNVYLENGQYFVMSSLLSDPLIGDGAEKFSNSVACYAVSKAAVNYGIIYTVANCCVLFAVIYTFLTWFILRGYTDEFYDKCTRMDEADAKGTVEIADDLPAWRQAELRALNEYGGYEQLSYLKGEQVSAFTDGATRPDIVRNLGDHIEAVEVKFYNLDDPSSVRVLLKEIRREVTDRVLNLPHGSTQRIILDVTGRGFSETTCTNVVNEILTLLADVYPSIPIEIVGLL